MDAYEDTLRAFDHLLAWLNEDPEIAERFIHQGKEVYALRHPGEYWSELRTRTENLMYFMNQMFRDGFKHPDNYTWRRFRDNVQEGCNFDHQSRYKDEQAEVRKVVSAAREEFVRIRSGVPLPKLDPFLTDSAYEEILTVIRAWAEGVERGPVNVKALDEEGHRSQCLGMLNYKYEGRASGETFNKQGKTDVFLRAEGGAVFVAEFKVWGGAAVLTEAIDQLLGYLTWRDTKAALVMINRTAGLTRVVQVAAEAARNHLQFVRSVRHEVQNESRQVFRHPDDDQRLVTVTILFVEAAP